jgi:hypothetical protein
MSTISSDSGSELRSLREIGLEQGTDKVTQLGYDPWYERVFGPLRCEPLKVLELGVHEGASLRLWEAYFPHAEVWGVDILPICKDQERGRIRVRIGDQADPAFIAAVADEIGPIDIVIDDASHIWGNTLASFDLLWPRVKSGGWYVIEDLQVCYPSWGADYSGGAPLPPTEMIKRQIDHIVERTGSMKSLTVAYALAFMEKA